MAIFPGDICDLIIEALHYSPDDKPAPEPRRTGHQQMEKIRAKLRARARKVVRWNSMMGTCALVCRTWTYRSRSLQFRSLLFLTATISYPPDASVSSRLSSFMVLVQSPWATIPLHVRDIRQWTFLHSADQTTGPLLRSDFMPLASFSALEFILLYNFSSQTEYPTKTVTSIEDIVSVLGSLRQLKRLSLSSWTLESFAQLCDVVSACRGLEELDLNEVNVSQTPQILPYQPIMPLSPPPIRAFSVYKSTFEGQMVVWMASCATSLPIRSLKVGFSETFILNSTSCGSMLQTIGSSLEHLYIDCLGVSSKHENIFENLDLGHNSRLETLTLRNCNLQNMRHNAIALIGQVSSCNILEITIEIDERQSYPPFEDVQGLSPFGAIDAIFRRPNFARLTKLNILAGWTHGEEFSNEMFRAAFPHFAARATIHLKLDAYDLITADQECC